MKNKNKRANQVNKAKEDEETGWSVKNRERGGGAIWAGRGRDGNKVRGEAKCDCGGGGGAGGLSYVGLTSSGKIHRLNFPLLLLLLLQSNRDDVEFNHLSEMASLVERLRVRSDRRPIYSLDESDDDDDLGKKKFGPGTSQEKFERPDVVGPLTEIEKILDCEMRPTPVDDSDASKLGSDQVGRSSMWSNVDMCLQYLNMSDSFSLFVSSVSLFIFLIFVLASSVHCFRVPEMEFVNSYRSNPRLRTKVNNFHKQALSNNNPEDEYVPIRPEWTTVDRIIACREVEEEKEYLVKWKELSYDECYWELESDIASFHKEIERFSRIQSRYGKVSAAKEKSNLHDAMESKKKQKEFQHYDSSPEFLSGGT
ncbi:hypothetical protein RD792_013237 [Penstemon davidsonii]|uniref:Chromo domain-containing protein n=1 Tax=Penstemon davidsonii TaxID=160366 RepID=A0ABR0CTW1_9LAMI|nr:hypothetical protein RD792_013237 [Penstemon davidsonii]